MVLTKPGPLYGLDIETDTAAGGLDPRRAGIVAVGLSSADGETVFTGSESGVLAALDAHLHAWPPGVIVTWNGSGFDLPFLASRALRCGVALGLVLRRDPTIISHRPGLPGHSVAFRGRWHGHHHLDACLAYRRLIGPGESCGLKAVARSVGLHPVEVDSAAIHLLPVAVVRSYVASDASVTRELALRRWPEVRAFIDVVTPGSGRASGWPPPLPPSRSLRDR